MSGGRGKPEVTGAEGLVERLAMDTLVSPWTSVEKRKLYPSALDSWRRGVAVTQITLDGV